MLLGMFFSLIPISNAQFEDLPDCTVGRPDFSGSRAYTLPDGDNIWNSTIPECARIDNYPPRQSRRCCDSGALALAKSASMTLCRKTKGKKAEFYSARYISGADTVSDNPCVPSDKAEKYDICLKFNGKSVPTGSISKKDTGGCQPYTLYTCNPQAPETKEICPKKPYDPTAKIMAHIGSSYFCNDGRRVDGTNTLPRGQCLKVGKELVATVEEMKQKLEEYGSLLIRFCFDPIKGYNGGIIGGHDPCPEEKKDQYAIIVGEDRTEAGLHYWIVENTFGVEWAPSVKGQFKILSGSNQLGIEENVQAVDINYEENAYPDVRRFYNEDEVCFFQGSRCPFETIPYISEKKEMDVFCLPKKLYHGHLHSLEHVKRQPEVVKRREIVHIIIMCEKDPRIMDY